MKLLRNLILLAVFASCATAQLLLKKQSIDSLGQLKPSFFSPTSMPDGSVAVTWWDGHLATTNTGVFTIPSLTTNNWPLTNSDVESTWPTNIAAGLNGNNVWRFDAVGSYVKTVMPTNNQPFAVCFVVRYWGSTTDTTLRYLFARANDTATTVLWRNGSAGTTMRAVAGVALNSVGSIPTNSFMCLSATFNGANSVVSTNGVTLISGDAGGGALRGFLLCNAQALNAGSGWDIASVVVFTNLSATTHSNFYAWATNKYGAANFP